MADLKISELPVLNGPDLNAVDAVALADLSASETRQIDTKQFLEEGTSRVIDDGIIPGEKLVPDSVTAKEIAPDAITDSELADNAVDTASIQDLAVTNSKIALGVDGAKLINDTVTASKIPSSSLDRGIDKTSGRIGHTNVVAAATMSGITFDDQGHISAAVRLVSTDLPPATTDDIGGVSVPADSGLTVSGAGVLDHENNLGAGLMSGITYDDHGHISAAVPLVGSDLPPATDTTLGGVIVSGPVLEVTGTGEISHGDSPVAPGAYPKVSVDQLGHVTAGLPLLQADVPALDASILTTGTLDPFRFKDLSIEREKLANYAISYIQEGQPSVTAVHHIGCLWYQESTAQLRMYNGNSWMPVGFGRLSADNLRFGGTIDASTGAVSYVTLAGITAGVVVGGALPVATDILGGIYFLVDNGGSGINIYDVNGVTFNAGDWVLAVSEIIGWIRIDNAGGGGGGGASYLDDLLDVTLTSPDNGEALVFDSSIDQWRNVGINHAKADFVEGIDGVRTSFELTSDAYSINGIRISIGGIIQEPGVDFSFAAPRAIAFVAAPPIGIEYWVTIAGGNGGTPATPGTKLATAQLVQPQMISTADRNLIVVGANDLGRMIYNTTKNELQHWDGTAWQALLAEPEIDGGSF